MSLAHALAHLRAAAPRLVHSRPTLALASTSHGPRRCQHSASPPSSASSSPPHSSDPPHEDSIHFPDPHDPHQHPLAPLSYDNLQNDNGIWRKKAKPIPPRQYVRKVSEDGVAVAKGGRKASQAHVSLRQGVGQISVNGRSWLDYFPRVDQRDRILRPLQLVAQIGRFDIDCHARGGGTTGQTDAIRLAIARALQNWRPEWRPLLKKDGLLTRDARIVEPKKYGRKKARKSFQWVKR